jgi:hypothetical protein
MQGKIILTYSFVSLSDFQKYMQGLQLEYVIVGLRWVN